MRRIFTISSLLALLLCFSTSAMAQAPILGSWEGKLKVSNAFALTVVLHIQDGEGQLNATMDSPDQGVKGIPVTKISFSGNQLDFTVSSIGFNYHGTYQDDKLTGEATQMGHSLPLTFERAKDIEEEVAEPLPYEVEEVRIKNLESGLTIAGTLTYPSEGGPFQAVVLIAGSGPMDRDSRFMQHHPLADIADHLTRAGLMVLRYDKRGIGESEGDYGSSNYAELNSDARAVLHYIKQHANVAAGKVGIIGHSEGGMVGQMLLAKEPDLADFFVMLASPAVPNMETIIFQNQVVMDAYLKDSFAQEHYDLLKQLFEVVVHDESTQEDKADAMHTYQEAILLLSKEESTETLKGLFDNESYITGTLMAYNSPYYISFLQYDPADYLPLINKPTLALYGEKDHQVEPIANSQRLKQLKPEATVEVIPNLNHLFLQSETGKMEEYMHLTGTFDDSALRVLTEWIKKNS